MIKQAIVLAAGLGTRLMPLTNSCPKPMLEVNGKPLMVYTLEALSRSGVKDVVIHVSYLADLIIDNIADGKNWGLDLNIVYSRSNQPLESGGGIKFSKPYLSNPNKEFICVNGDVITDFNYDNLRDINLDSDHIYGHMVLVKNPPENPDGDYDIKSSMLQHEDNPDISYPYTFTGIAVYHPDIININDQAEGFSIIDNINNNIGKISASIYNGFWYDVGTIERYQEVIKKYGV